MIIDNVDADELKNVKYDIIVAALGFEKRSTAVSEFLAGKFDSGIALGFDHNHSCSYDDNEKWFHVNHFDVVPDVKSADFHWLLEEKLRSAISGNDATNCRGWIKIGIDISCFDRRRMAELVHSIQSLKSIKVSVDFWYCIAEFHPPSRAAGRNEVAGPVHRKFAGRFTEPGRPLALIAGLGYELGRVMGAAEYLQASRIIAFVPESPLSEYETEVYTANESMLKELEARQILRYPVADPERTLAMLDSTIRGLEPHYNVVLLPGGPKIFALCSLIACTLHRNAAVWRVSSGGSIKPRDVLPSEHFVGLRWLPHGKFEE